MTKTSGSGRQTEVARGFTLVELLVVIGIMAVMVALVAPSIHLTDASHNKINTAVRRISGAVAQARSVAMLTGERPKLKVFANRLSLDGFEDAKLPEGVRIIQLEVSGDDRLTPMVGDFKSLVFHPSGLTMPAAIMLEGDREYATVFIKLASRRLVVKEGRVSIDDFGDSP